MKPIISTLDAESGASSQGGLGRRLPTRSQLVDVTLTLSGEEEDGTIFRGLTMSTFMPSKPSEPAKSISLSKGPVLSTNAVFLDTFAWTKVLLLKLPVERNKESQT